MCFKNKAKKDPRDTKPDHEADIADKDDLRVKDWEMAINQTINLNNTIIQIRLQGIPIAIAIFTAGYAAFQYFHGIKALGIPALAFLPLFGTIYLIVIALIDLFYFNLMRTAIGRAEEVERLSQKKLFLMRDLTTPTRTTVHIIALGLLYIALIAFGLISTYIFLIS